VRGDPEEGEAETSKPDATRGRESLALPAGWATASLVLGICAAAFSVAAILPFVTDGVPRELVGALKGAALFGFFALTLGYLSYTRDGGARRRRASLCVVIAMLIMVGPMHN